MGRGVTPFRFAVCCGVASKPKKRERVLCALAVGMCRGDGEVALFARVMIHPGFIMDAFLG